METAARTLLSHDPVLPLGLATNAAQFSHNIMCGNPCLNIDFKKIKNR